MKCYIVESRGEFFSEKTVAREIEGATVVQLHTGELAVVFDEAVAFADGEVLVVKCAG